MQVIKTVEEMQKFSKVRKAEGKTVGFVPTMGFLHKGHLSLVKKANQECDVVVVSIFVNPTQFAPNEDFEAYPRDFEKDSELCEKEGVEAIFYPSSEEMYKGETKLVEVGEIGKVLCGKSRPTHFRGVATIVAKLFEAVMPDSAYFGLKDFQQFVIIKKMVKNMNFDINIVGCPIVREKDGLAMSSRNAYLSKQERSEAVVLNKSLALAEKMFSKGEKNSEKVRQTVSDKISETSGKIDYVEIFDSASLKSVEEIEKGNRIGLAVFFGKTRLIDNKEFE